MFRSPLCGLAAAFALWGLCPIAKAQAPSRIVSLDYCADQYVLALARPDQIAALSVDSSKHFSYFREKARGFRKIRPRAEDALALHPDLIVRSYGGGPNADRLLARTGARIAQLGYPNDLAGIRSELIAMGRALGREERALELALEFDRVLAVAARPPSGKTILYHTPGGVTAGSDTLIGQLMLHAGFTPYSNSPGWAGLPIERLAQEPPDLILAAEFSATNGFIDPWSKARHPIMRRTMRQRPVLRIDGAATACSAWFLADLAARLAKAQDGAGRS